MENPKQDERPLKDIITNLEYVISCDYPHEVGKMPTRAILGKGLFNLLINVDEVVINTKAGKKDSKRLVLAKYPKIKIFVEHELYKSQYSSILRYSKRMNLPLTLGCHGFFKRFKKIISYDLDKDLSNLI
jgi:hypothetical protein